MYTYFATFPAGTYELIAKQLKSFKVEELRIVEADDSSVVFRSSLQIERLIELRYFTNVYLVIDDMQSIPRTICKGKYFRLMFLRGGTPELLGQSQRADLQAAIKKRFGLEANAHQSRNDFYVIERDSGQRLLALRLPRAKFKREKLAAGELRPELAHILCLAAGLKSKDTVVDLFAGYGAIPLEAVRGFGCKKVIAVDYQNLKNRRQHPCIQWYENDARKVNFTADNSVDRIVTDPPWGMYAAADSPQSLQSLQSLYADFAQEAERILRPDGIAVILSGFDEIETSLKAAKHLRLIKHWNVLVSGKKATVYKLQKVR